MLNRSNDALVSEYWYNGVGHRITWLYDTNGNGATSTAGGDVKFHFAHDERWRVVAVYRANDASTRAKEVFFHHNAGLDGHGGSSYIDTLILREKDANTNWTSQSDLVLERRDYYCHNWRGDVVCMITNDGKMVGWVKYAPNGEPCFLPSGDTDGSGAVDATDSTNATN